MGVARRCVVLGSVVGVLVAGPGAVARAAEVPAYAYDREARAVNGASGTSDAVRLEAGSVYRSSLAETGKAYFQVELDAVSTTYVSVTAVPGDDEVLTFNDGVKVSLQDANGLNCSSDVVTFGSAVSPHPVTAWAGREIRAGRSVCQGAGTYYVVVERAGGRGAGSSAGESSSGEPSGSASSSASASASGDGVSWGLEMAVVSEPPVGLGGATVAPRGWSSATPSPLAGKALRRPGGAGFAMATDLEEGAWRDDILPGQTLFYSVPVEWGQQVYVTAELGSAGGGSGFVASALDVTLYNPVRAQVEDLRFGYDGEQKTGTMRPLPPVDYANRYASSGSVSGMRFAGGYFLVVHLAGQVGERFGDGVYGVTLRVRVKGAAQEGPGYRGASVPRGLFGSTGVASGASGSGGASDVTAGRVDEEGGGTVMVAVAAGGFGVGTLLLAVLGVWVVVGRRRAGQVG